MPRASKDEQLNSVTYGVALSGGGVRASLFSLGVLKYLVDTGLNQQVAVVSSVSGGSIANAAVASDVEDFSKVAPNEFDHTVASVATTLAKQGSFFLERIWPIFLIVSAGLGFITAWANDATWAAVVFGALTAVATFVGFWILLYLIPFVRRRTLQERTYRRLTAPRSRAATFREAISESRRNRRWRLCDWAQSEVDHVICATEIQSGEPIYFSRTFVHSPMYGTGWPNTRVSSAVYASAAVPGAFPPLRFHTHRLNMSGGTRASRPKLLLTYDGGLYNNLATDWFIVANNAAALQVGISDLQNPSPKCTGRYIVVNASAPPAAQPLPTKWLSNVWPLRTIRSLLRAQSIQYQNTIEPRLAAMASDSNTIVITISNSILDVVDLQARSRRQGEPVIDKTAELILELRVLRQLWVEMSREASEIKTTLGPIGSDRAALLLRHGYLCAFAALHGECGDTRRVPDLPNERIFRDLASYGFR